VEFPANDTIFKPGKYWHGAVWEKQHVDLIVATVKHCQVHIFTKKYFSGALNLKLFNHKEFFNRE
jgi:hypothetical protein